MGVGLTTSPTGSIKTTEPVVVDGLPRACCLIIQPSGELMRIAGPSKQAIKLLSDLDASKLTELAADMLAVMGHDGIKITDGPGDGSRDIYSRMPSGLPHLTQCKYHENTARSVSANQLGELPLGLVRYGYSHGMFVTNARISPQAKRDYTEAYPGLELTYIQGSEIAPAVFENAILRALWYDGETLDRVTYALVVPFIAREMRRDKPLCLVAADEGTIEDGSCVPLLDGVFSMSIRRSFVSTAVFEPYRPPEVKTLSEHWLPEIRAVEAVITGPALLRNMDECVADSASWFADELLGRPHPRGCRCALRHGRVLLAPLGGASAGARIELQVEPATRLLLAGKQYEEWDWLMPDPKRGWVHAGAHQASQADWVRWYSAKLNACLDLTLISSPGRFSHCQAMMSRALVEDAWHRSRFALVPKSGLNELTTLPSRIADWGSGEALCAWLVKEFQTGLFPAPMEFDEEVDWYSEESLADRIDSHCEEQAVGLGGKAVDPHSARHMFAAVGADPYPDTDTVEYRSADLLLSPETVPSPIDIYGRRIAFDVCWSLGKEVVAEHLTDFVRSSICYNNGRHRFDATFRTDVSADQSVYLLAHLAVREPDATLTTSDLLQALEPSLVCALENLECKIGATGYGAKRATGEFWAREIGLVYTDWCSVT